MSRGVAMGIVLERVGELPCPLRCLLLSLFLLGGPSPVWWSLVKVCDSF